MSTVFLILAAICLVICFVFLAMGYILIAKSKDKKVEEISDKLIKFKTASTISLVIGLIFSLISKFI